MSYTKKLSVNGIIHGHWEQNSREKWPAGILALFVGALLVNLLITAGFFALTTFSLLALLTGTVNIWTVAGFLLGALFLLRAGEK